MPIPDALKQQLLGRTWYHQRFDGAPMFIYAIAEAEFRPDTRRPAGNEPAVRICFFENGAADWYMDLTDIEQGAAAFVELAKIDPAISEKLLAAWKEDEEKFERFFWEELPHYELAGLADADLLQLWERYHELQRNRFSSTAIIDHFALGTDQLISQILRQELGQTTKESDFTEVFSTATAPIHQSFSTQAEIELLQIATGKSEETLAEYQARYFWLKNNYVTAQELPVEHFQAEIAAWQATGKDLAAEMTRLVQTPAVNRQKKQKLFARQKFSPLLRTLLKISEDFTWWQDERKRATYLNISIGSRLLAEVSRRTGYALEWLKYAYAPEVPTILLRGVPTAETLQARRAGSAFVYTRDSVAIAVGGEAAALRTDLLGSESFGHIDDIRGLAASMGQAIGTVKVVNSVTEIGKVEVGDILVAVMTRPDYLPAMKKAAAIITDEGGITSHAAIVSRELGVPCLIGTKIATAVFQDGDQVQVNANHGWVRKMRAEG